ncbi:MAG: PQQ-binding-like beta-propeller repeat protein [Planctomycetota bacterium]|nr:PQQ-binding-like beta-propeller repeat protein [Planctomycetota bacterium]
MSLCVCLHAARAATPGPSVPGAPAFQPTPENPVGFRGDGTGRFPGATPPTAWSRTRAGSGYDAKGIVWAAPLPAGGISSPIVAGNRVFVTCEFADLVCLDRQTGRILWIRSNFEFESLSDEERKAMPAIAEKLDPLLPQVEKLNAEIAEALNAQLPGAAASDWRMLPAIQKKRALEKRIREELAAIDKKRFVGDWPQVIYGFCTETPCSDGTRVCAFFASGVAVCYDMNGKRLWIAHGTRGGEEKGHYSSPVVAGGQFVVWGDPEMRGYEIATGKVLWRNPVQGSNCGSLYRFVAGGELVVGLQTTGFTRLRDGRQIWKGRNLEYSFTSAIVEGNAIYMWTPGGNKSFKSYTVPASCESGQVTPKLTFKKVEWGADELAGKFEKGDLNASPLFVDGLIYQLYCGGGLAVQDAATGEVVYRKLLPLKPRTEYWAWGGASASPALAGKYIYLMDNQGTTVVIEPGRQYKEVAVNHVADLVEGKHQAQNLSTPVFQGERLYYRSPHFLFCIGPR